MFCVQCNQVIICRCHKEYNTKPKKRTCYNNPYLGKYPIAFLNTNQYEVHICSRWCGNKYGNFK